MKTFISSALKAFAFLFILIISFSKVSAQCKSFAFCDYTQGKVFIMENDEIV